MGQAKRRSSGIGLCIYCESNDNLSDEHVLPYGLGGDLILNKASCERCRVITGKLEQKLLRGHWWPYRKKLGLQSRNPDASKELKSIKIIKSNGDTISGKMPLESFVAAMVFKLKPPSILDDKQTSGEPSAEEVFIKMLGPMPTEAVVDERRYLINPDDKVEFPVDFDSRDLTRFLAKVAHGYAIYKEGLEVCSEFYLPNYILGKTDGIQNYVGGYMSPIITTTLTGGGYNRMMLRNRNKYVTVCIQLFIDKHDPPPIYEIVVGKKRI